MISIVIPVYNKEEHIEYTMRSVLNQTFKDFELILVDDGSTDNSSKVIGAFKDKRIRIIPIPNSGVAIARNMGIEAAKFDFIAFLDADDWWANNFLEEIVNLIYAFPDKTVFATGRCRVFNEEVERYDNQFLPEDGQTGILNYIQIISRSLPPINSSNVVISKSLLKKAGGFKPHQKQHEDHDLWLRICYNNEIVFKNVNLSYYRKMVSNSASSKVYDAGDFIKYLDTLLFVKGKLAREKKLWFKKYCRKFIVLTYLKHSKKYNKTEIEEVLKKIRSVLGRPLYLLIRILENLHIYTILKYFKK